MVVAMNFSSIAIFILATTAINTRFTPQDYPTYFESRILPITQTWGSFFPHLYFVFGTNQFDFQFLKSKCSSTIPKTTESSSLPSTEHINDLHEVERVADVAHKKKKRGEKGRRKLVPHTPQMSLNNKTYLLYCARQFGDGKYTKLKNLTNVPQESLSSPAVQSYFTYLHNRKLPWKALYVGNCTGEYFGSGPTCRCEEAIRYFLNHEQTTFREVKWMIFMDDDVYLRPFAFSSFLSQFENTHLQPSNRAVTLISSDARHEIRNAKHKKFQNYTDSCNRLFQNSFHLAQPAIFNRAALDALRPFVEANAFLRLQGIWGGSHDVILGLVLWLAEVDLFSFADVYHGLPMTFRLDENRDHPKTSDDRRRELQRNFLVFHKVLNFIQYSFNKKAREAQAKFSYGSQYSIAAMLGEVAYYDDFKAETELTAEVLEGRAREETEIGREFVRKVRQLQRSTHETSRFKTRKTKAVHKAAGVGTVVTYDEDFTPADC